MTRTVVGSVHRTSKGQNPEQVARDVQDLRRINIMVLNHVMSLNFIFIGKPLNHFMHGTDGDIKD